MSSLRGLAFVLLAMFTPLAFPKDISQEHRTSVARLLDALHVEEAIKLSMLKYSRSANRKTEPDSQAFVQELLDIAQPGEFRDRLIPVYAKYISSVDADTIALFWESPTGVKKLRDELNSLKEGKTPSLNKAKYTKFDFAYMDVFARSSAGQAFIRSQVSVKEESTHVLRAFGEELATRKLRQVLMPLLREADPVLAGQLSGVDSPPAPLPLMTKGGGIIDQVGTIIADGVKESHNIKTHLERDLKKIGVHDLLNPENLVSQTAILDGKQKTQLLSDSLARYLKSSNELQQRLYQKLSAIQFPPEIKKGFTDGIEKELSLSYERAIRFGENQRKLVELTQRIFDFAESRLGKITFTNGELLFAEEADLEVYRILLGQIKSEAAQENTLLKERNERQAKALRALTTEQDLAAPSNKQTRAITSGDTKAKTEIAEERQVPKWNYLEMKHTKTLEDAASFLYRPQFQPLDDMPEANQRKHEPLGPIN